MATDTQPQTFSDLKNAFFDLVRDSATSTLTTMAERYLNEALHDLHIDPGHSWPWAIRRGMLITHAAYATGTVTIDVSVSRTAVTGASTVWTTAVDGFGYNNIRAGGKITFSGSNDVHVVSAVGGATSLTLESMWVGDDLTAASYSYFEDEYALVSDFLRPVDMRMFSTDLNIPFIGAMEFRRAFPRNSHTSKPRVATWLQLGFSGTTSPRHRVALSPTPDAAYSIPYNYITTNLAVSSAGAEQANMTSDTDEPIVPVRYRHVIPLGAAYKWLMFRKDDGRSQEVKGEYADLVMRMAGDAGIIGQDRPQLVVRRGIGGSGRLGRFDVGSRFDDLRDRW